jgi:electron transport complex protein RnfC
MRRFFSFRHGVHPPESKELTAALATRRMPFPDEIVLPLRQHAGKPARAIVAAGARVERGDKLAEADGFVSVPVHASASGTVTEVGPYAHPDGSFATAIRIAVEPFSAQVPRPRLVPEPDGLTTDEIVRAVQEAGVVGLGGAAFPAHVKLTPPPDAKIETLIINGCECEPYLTTDHRTMVDYPARVFAGIRIMMRCLGVSRAMIGIEKNKPDAIEALRAIAPSDLDIAIVPLTVKYPQGAEKMLIKALVVATIAEVFETGLPLIERIITVTGHGVRKPANLIVPVGTRLRDLIDACGGLTEDAREIVNGGPMMGSAPANLDAPVLKGTTGIVVLTERDCRTPRSYPCIRCGRCLDACPVFLDPQILGDLAGAARYEEMQNHHLMDCMLCGCCSYVCPSNIPLSQLFGVSKNALRKIKASE